MRVLGPGSFPEFFMALHRNEPFPWQTRLARQVVETGAWPPLLDLPTGAGKTAALDIAVFHLACEAENGPERRAPMRSLFVVDRRIVVDSAFERAARIADALANAQDGILKIVAERLRLLSGKGPPLAAVRLRGGVPQERDWAQSPAQPLIAISTVDQAGSRLLFRGYGVSPRMWPVHAGLVGADVLWLLDEVHLSKPFEETLDAIAEGHGAGSGYLAERRRLAPFQVVKLSATPGALVEKAFKLAEQDRKHPGLCRRLAASKVARLVTIDGDPVAEFAEQALRLAGLAGKVPEDAQRSRTSASAAQSDRGTPAARVAVVVNRVALARDIFTRLKEKLGEAADVLLLTGRLRPLDRDALLATQPFAMLRAEPRRQDPVRPIIVIATQTIEAGADLDFEALVTQIAPLDCLRQRFGRLDRLGRSGSSHSVIVAPGKQARENWKEIEAIYGDAARKTANWLQSFGGDVDFGIDAFAPRLDRTEAEELAGLLAPRARAPVLLPAYADLWATTSPAPAATPEPALFLHGENMAADVSVVWRADVDPENEERANCLLDLCPPSALEGITLPLWAVRAWLRRQANAFAIADVPERMHPDLGVPRSSHQVLRRVGDAWVKADAADLRPGDTIVSPCRYGGCDAFGWNPQRREQVTDLGTEAHYRQRRKGALRFTKDLIDGAVWSRIAALTAGLGDDCSADSLRASIGQDAIELPRGWSALLLAMTKPQLDWLDDEDRAAGFVLYSEEKLASGLLDGSLDEGGDGDEAITDRAGDSLSSSSIGVNVTLAYHLAHVEAKARSFAGRAGLDVAMTNCVALAAALHDLGKADPRFQMDLRGIGALVARDPMLAVLLAGDETVHLAKSAQRSGTRGGLRASPENFRHEALSVALADKHSALTALSNEDRDIVLWLIGTHHGFGRPFFPPSNDPAPQTETVVTIGGRTLAAQADEAPLRLDQHWFERAERLRRRFGPWELARLEAVVRLADHAASAEERENAQ